MWSFLLFPSGKYRLTVKNDDVNIDSVIEYLSHFVHIPHTYQLQTETFKLAISRHVNLQLYKEANSSNVHVQYEPELFPAMRLTLWPKILVNIFHTGNVIIMGRKSRHFLDAISQYLNATFSQDSEFTF